MFSITTVIVNPDDGYRLEEGALYKVPIELRSAERLRRYCALGKPGWHVDDWGFKLYCQNMPSGDRIIIPALELLGEARARRRFHGYTPKFSKQNIEAYAASLIEFSQQESVRVQSSLNMLIHDLRSLSTTILHSNNEARHFLYRDITEAEVRIGNVEAAQAILRMRIDAFDLLSNSNPMIITKNVPVFKKVDKVVRFFKCSANTGSKRIFLTGSSHKLLNGPDVFELVPFSLLDNAVKYAPSDTIINVQVNDDDRTRLLVTSLGPKIRKTEEKLIFLNGTRGSMAKESQVPGTGVGLHLVSRIVKDFFKGDVWVQQSQIANVYEGREFFETTFTVDIPTHPPLR